MLMLKLIETIKRVFKSIVDFDENWWFSKLTIWRSFDSQTIQFDDAVIIVVINYNYD